MHARMHVRDHRNVHTQAAFEELERRVLARWLPKLEAASADSAQSRSGAEGGTGGMEVGDAVLVCVRAWLRVGGCLWVCAMYVCYNVCMIELYVCVVYVCMHAC